MTLCRKFDDQNEMDNQGDDMTKLNNWIDLNKKVLNASFGYYLYLVLISQGVRTRKKRVFGLGLDFKISVFQVRIRVWIRKIQNRKPDPNPKSKKSEMGSDHCTQEK